MRPALAYFLTCGMAAACPPELFAENPNPAELAGQAKAVLAKHCYACHGKDGKAEFGLYVLNREKLVAARKLIPGKAAESLLHKRMRSGEMPPDEDEDGKKLPRPTAEEVDAVKRWIDAGAPDFAAPPPARAFVANGAMLDSIKADLEKAAERDRRFLRYFTITHLHNAGLPEDELAAHRAGLSKLVNSLSWGREVHVPVPIDAAKTILRIDLRDFEWDEEVWDTILRANPYGMSYATPTAQSCYALTKCAQPYVRADWFVHAASRPPLYHDVLRLPQSDVELEKKLDVDVAKNIRNERIWRAGFNESGVSRNNRLIERHRSPYGAYWKSYDFAGNVGRQNLFQYPLGPGAGQDCFQHDGGEIIFNLPNGLQAYLLVDGHGKRIDKGPTSIVSDPKQGDRAVVNGVSCMSCHAQGMIRKDDQVRPHVEKNPNAFAKEEAATILALYAKKEEMDKRIAEDEERFRKAVEATGAALSKTEPVSLLAKQFENQVGLAAAAAEAGCTPEELLKGLEQAPALARIFGPLRTSGGTVQRQALVASFGDLVRVLQPTGAFIPAAQPGEAEFQQARKFENGEGAAKDLKEAAAWYRRAAEKGHAAAQYDLAHCLHHGLGVPRDDQEAVVWYRRAAEQDFAEAQSQLAFMFLNGLGTAEDPNSAFRWYRRSAEAGCPSGQNGLGHCYAQGVGVVKDEKEAVAWYRKAADQGLEEAMDNLGDMHYAGRGVEKDYAEAVRWYRQAATKGLASGQFNLGYMLEHGLGAVKDSKEAADWYRKAADQGHATAQNNLGYLLSEGDGVAKDEREAVAWFRKAAEQGEATAQNSLGNMLYGGRGVEKDYAEAVLWYRKSAEQGHARGQYNLGYMLEHGLGVGKSLDEAVQWYRKAAVKNHPEAAEALKRLRRE